MMTKLRRAGAVLAALMMAACAGNPNPDGPAGDGEAETLRVIVENDGTIPTQVRIYLMRDGGSEHMVGTMSTLGTETLTTQVAELGGTYQLRAEGGTSYRLVSPRVQLRGNETIAWDMRRNLVRINQ